MAEQQLDSTDRRTGADGRRTNALAALASVSGRGTTSGGDGGEIEGTYE